MVLRNGRGWLAIAIFFSTLLLCSFAFAEIPRPYCEGPLASGPDSQCDKPRSSPKLVTPRLAQAETDYAERPSAGEMEPSVSSDLLRLDRAKVPAIGEQDTILSIPSFGRYSVAVKSGQGVSLQLIDRMTGPGEVMGEAGNRDGRIDQFLDRGQYKVLLRASEQGTGAAEIVAHSFTELNGNELPLLRELDLIETTLGDYEQRSYWLYLDHRQVVAIEAGGRNLADMRLWRDGNWLVDAKPEPAVLEPEQGKPIAVQRIVARLEPGFYQLSTYGGPPLPWAKTSDAKPLYLRMGIPDVTEAARQSHRASPFGVDRYLVPASTNFFRLELPEAEPAQISVGPYDEMAPFALGHQETITKQSLPPVVEFVGASQATGLRLITVSREAGKPYLLQHFQAVREYEFNGSGEYWISTLHSGTATDNVDATGILTSEALGDPQHIINSNAPKLARNVLWSRQFNFIEPLTIFFNVVETGGYKISGTGADGECSFEPFVRSAANYKAPTFRPIGFIWALDSGYYVLSCHPIEDGKGILTLQIAGQTSSGFASEVTDQTKEGSVQWPRVNLAAGNFYTLYLNEQPGVMAGVILRKIPVDLTEGLPIRIAAGTSLDVPVTAPEDGTVTAVGENGDPVPFSLDLGNEVTEWRSTGGQHVLTVKNSGPEEIRVTLTYRPNLHEAGSPLPPRLAEALAASPKFPLISPRQAEFFDITKDEQRTFAINISQPGLYRVESSGLLQTEGTIRTRTVIAMDHQANNGVGRNFLIQQYLGQGAYQISTQAQGETRGRMGLKVTPTELFDAGELAPGLPIRQTLRAGEGLVLRFRTAQAGQYRLRSLGLGRTFNMRLEDGDGWPIIAPNGPAEYVGNFRVGSYRMIILPQAVDARVVTSLEPITDRPELVGHGPHDLALNQPQGYQWLEPENGEERTPDQWRFVLPAASHVTINLSRGMRGELFRLEPTQETSVLEIRGGEAWLGPLPAGSYVLKAATWRPNNRFDYSLLIGANELMAGQEREVTTPVDIPISIGADRIVEIGSFGTLDAQASLFDNQGHLIASNDDRPNDWNFSIARRLVPGFYRLHVEADGNNGSTTTITVHQADETQDPTLIAGRDLELSGSVAHVIPLNLPNSNGVVVVSADSGNANLSLILEERQKDGHWQTLAERSQPRPWIALPLDSGELHNRFRLRLWAIDGGKDRIQLVNPIDRNHVAIVVPIAAGMEPLNPSLATAPPEAKPMGETTLAPTYVAYLDDQIEYFFDTLPKGTYQFAFRTRAQVAGSFIQPAAYAEMMYDPSVNGNSSGAMVMIEKSPSQ